MYDTVKIKRLVVLGMVVIFCGCGTVLKTATRNDNDSQASRIYLATRSDFYFLYRCIIPDNNSFMPISEFSYLAPFALIDIPFAFVLDTVQIPWDGYRYYEGRKNNKYIKGDINTSISSNKTTTVDNTK